MVNIGQSNILTKQYYRDSKGVVAFTISFLAKQKIMDQIYRKNVYLMTNGDLNLASPIMLGHAL